MAAPAFVIDQARAWYAEEGGTLRDYLDWADTQADENARVAEAVLPEIGVNAVRIMTIHAAKGLQFPMVIVAGLTGGFRTANDPVIWDGNGNPGSVRRAGREIHRIRRRLCRRGRTRRSGGGATETERVTAVSAIRSSYSATHIGHRASDAGTAVLQSFADPGEPIAVAPGTPSIDSSTALGTALARGP